MLKDRRNIHIYLTIAVMIFIFVQSAMPGKVSSAESNIFVRLLAELTGLPTDLLKPVVRKTAHFTEYMVLGACLAVNLRDWERSSRKALQEWWTVHVWRWRALVPWGIGTLYAVSDEIHQAFVPRRACALLDMCIDSAGAAAGVLLASLVLYWWRTKPIARR